MTTHEEYTAAIKVVESYRKEMLAAYNRGEKIICRRRKTSGVLEVEVCQFWLWDNYDYFLGDAIPLTDKEAVIWPRLKIMVRDDSRRPMETGHLISWGSILTESTSALLAAGSLPDDVPIRRRANPMNEKYIWDDRVVQDAQDTKEKKADVSSLLNVFSEMKKFAEVTNPNGLPTCRNLRGDRKRRS